jgi:hypothetical protein
VPSIKSATDSSAALVQQSEEVAVPTAAAQAPAAARARSENAVEQFSGQAPRAGNSASPRPPGGTSNGAELSESMAAIRQSIDVGTFSWIGAADLAQVHHSLEALGPKDYKAAIEAMDKEGLLATYLGKLDPAARDAFLAQANRKGLVEEQPGSKASGPLSPPDSPATFRNDAKLPPSVRDAIFANAREAASSYCAQFGQYLNRYEEAAKAAHTGADLRALGELARSDVPPSGMDNGHPDAAKNARAWLSAGDYPSDARAQKVVSDKLADIIGEARVGAIKLDGELQVKVGDEKVAVKGSATSSGKTELKGELGHAEHLGPVTVGVSADTKGNVAVTERVDLPLVSLERTASSDGSFKHAAEVGAFGTSIDSAGKAEVSVGVGYAYANPTQGQFGAGVGNRLKLGGVDVKYKVGLSFNTMTKEASIHSLARGNPGVQGTPAELAAGRPWDQLPEATRNLHRRNGWTEQEWTAKLPRS